MNMISMVSNDIQTVTIDGLTGNTTEWDSLMCKKCGCGSKVRWEARS